MTNHICALCDDLITAKNDSNEHVLPNSIGGFKTVNGFICDPCNKKSGDKWESALARQLNPLSVFFSIKRDRKNPPPTRVQSKSGKSYDLHHDGKLTLAEHSYSTISNELGVDINIEAKTTKQAKQLIQRAKSEYPSIDIEPLLEQVSMIRTYDDDPIDINLSIGGHDVGRSIVKSALSLAVEAGVSHLSCEHAISYLKNPDNGACYGFYYIKDIIVNRPTSVPLHCVYVIGKPETRQILGYVELFGIYKMVLSLSSSYKGDHFENMYAINPMTGKQLQLDCKLELSPQDIEDAYNYKAYTVEKHIEAVNKVIPTGQQKAFENELARVIEQAYEQVKNNWIVKEGEEPTLEQLAEFKDLVQKIVTPFIEHHTKRSKPL
ncbi:HNH endonuclease [Shewanella sp. H8]|uniref:HNH endonuclease n=1 Tax=Shewanella sp. H8 TaxID=3342676 RepID=UPI003314D6B3